VYNLYVNKNKGIESAMKNKVNISKIAKESGLSIASVSRVVNGKNGVSEATRKKIDVLLKKYNYVSDSHLSREKKIALLCGSNEFGSYVGSIFDGIHAYSVEHALNTTLIFKNNNLKMTALEQVRDHQCSGVIVVIPSVFREELDALAKSELPVVLIDEAVYREGLGFIDHDAYSGSREAANYLLELGHRNIGYIEDNIQVGNHLQRMKAYENTLKEAGVEIKPAWHVAVVPDKPLREGAYIKMKELLRTAPELTAVMTTNDDLATGALKAIFDSGKRVPEDISVIGFDNYWHTEYLRPALTTVNHPVREIGYMAAQEIDLYLKNPQDRSLPHEILPTTLVIRESACAPSVPVQTNVV
jgi:DNA-binding LacI/PurR family transcriptional regulator